MKKKKKQKKIKEPVSTQSFQIIEPVFSDPVSESPHSDLSASQNLNSISEFDRDVTDVISDNDYDYQCSMVVSCENKALCLKMT